MSQFYFCSEPQHSLSIFLKKTSVFSCVFSFSIFLPFAVEVVTKLPRVLGWATGQRKMLNVPVDIIWHWHFVISLVNSLIAEGTGMIA